MTDLGIRTLIVAAALAAAVLIASAAPVSAQDAAASDKPAASPAPAGDQKTPTVQEIVDKTNLAAYYQGDDGRSDVKMTITSKDGAVRTREFTVLRLNVKKGGDQKFYVYFHEPADVRKMSYMVWKHTGGGDDDRWLYMPALDLVKRIAASDQRTSFVGSDFVYEDVSGRGINEDHHELVETTDKHYVLKNTPRDPKSVEFASYTMQIDKTTFLPMDIVYFDDKGEKIREIKSLETRTIEGFPTVMKTEVKDYRTGSTTVSEFSNVKYNVGLKDDLFTERYLRRPPREVRR